MYLKISISAIYTACLLALLIGCDKSQKSQQSAQPKTSEKASPVIRDSSRYAKGREMHLKGDYVGALQAYDRLLETNPSHTGALGNRALILEAREEFDAALKDYIALLRTEPDNLAALVRRATLYSKAGRYEEAIQDYNVLLETQYENASIHNDRGFALQESGRNAEALADFETALRLDPRFTEAWYNRGTARYLKGQIKLAEEDFLRTLNLNKNHLHACISLGQIMQFHRSKLDEAEVYFEKAQNLDPRHAEVWFNMGNLHYQQRLILLAVQDFEHAIKLDSNYTDAKMNKALAHYELKQFEKALVIYNQVLRKQPEYGRAYAMRGLLYCETGKRTAGCLDFSAAKDKGVKGIEEMIAKYCL